MSMRNPALFFSGLDTGERVGEGWLRESGLTCEFFFKQLQPVPSLASLQPLQSSRQAGAVRSQVQGYTSPDPDREQSRCAAET